MIVQLLFVLVIVTVHVKVIERTFTTLGGNELWRAMATKTKAFFNCLINVSTEKCNNLANSFPNNFI